MTPHLRALAVLAAIVALSAGTACDEKTAPPVARKSALADAAVAVVCGFGADSYELALRGLVKKLSANV